MNKVLIGLISLSLAAAVQAETFTVDAGHAEVGFSIKHMMVSNTKGTFNTFQGTLDYDIKEYLAADLVRLRMLVNGLEVDALSLICHRSVGSTR